MANFLSQFDLAPEAAAKLAQMAGKPAPAPAAPAGIDPSWLQAPPPPPPPAPPAAHASPAQPSPPKDLFAYAQSLRPEPSEEPAAPVAKASAPEASSGPTELTAPWLQNRPSGPVLVSPGGMRPHSVTTKEGFSQAETLPYAMAQGERLKGMDQAIGAEAEMGARKAARDVAYQATYAEAARKYADDVEALRQRREQYVNDKLEHLEGLAADARKEIDPEAYWKEKGTFAQVAAAIFVGLGAFASTGSGGQNTALSILNSAIDRNMQAQVKNSDNARSQLSTESNLYKMNLESFGDREQALKATRVNYLDATVAELDAKLGQENLPDAQRANGVKLRQQLLDERAKVVGDMTKLWHNEVVRQDVYQAPVYAGGGGAGAAAQKNENTVTLADGTTVQFQNKEQANKAVDRVQLYTQLQQMDSRAMQLRAKLAKATPGTAEHESIYSELEQMAVDRIYTDSMARGQGVVKEDEMKRGLELSPYMKGVGSRGAIVGQASRLSPWKDRDFQAGNNMIRANQERADQDQRALVKAAGGTIVSRGFARDASGNLVPIAQQTGQFVQPDDPLAPKGFKPFDPRARVPTRESTLQAQTPKGRIVSPGGTGGR